MYERMFISDILAKRYLGVLMACLVGCGTADPPCTFKVSHANVLFERQYENYAAAIEDGEHTVQFVEERAAVEVTVTAGFCKPFAEECAGPLTLEHLLVTSRTPEKVYGYQCV